MTEADLIHVYRTRAQTRLETAGSSLQRHPECQFELGMDSDLTRSDIAMRVWSAAVDIGSALMLQETHTIPNGRSTEITQFVSRTLHRQKPLMGFNVLWSTLVQLHNIQHRGYHDLSRFRSVARDANRSVSALNWALHPNNRLAPESYGWLVRVRQDFRNVFRDGSTDQIVDFAQTASVSAPLTESDQYPFVPRQLYLPICRQLVLPIDLLLLAALLGRAGAVAGDVKLQDDGVMDHPVNRRGGGHGVGEDALPLREDQV